MSWMELLILPGNPRNDVADKQYFYQKEWNDWNINRKNMDLISFESKNVQEELSLRNFMKFLLIYYANTEKVLINNEHPYLLKW